jgi:hypothetical protein
MISDREYFGRRAQEEREAAMKVAHPKARQAHMELANVYRRRASGLGVENFDQVFGVDSTG